MKNYTIEDLKTFERDKREILFRGKTKKTKEWVIGNGIVQGQDGISYTRWVDICDDKMRYEVLPETVGQFTGLTDKNGKKVFEGDIVGYVNSNNEMVIDGVVKYGLFNCSCCDGVYGWYIEGGDIRDLEKPNYFYEVIGNIHDIIELLEKK